MRGLIYAYLVQYGVWAVFAVRRSCLVKKAAVHVLRNLVPVGSGSVRKSGKKIGTALGGSAKKPKKIRYRAGGLRFLNARSSLYGIDYNTCIIRLVLHVSLM